MRKIFNFKFSLPRRQTGILNFHKGFTAIEMIIVLGIVGILTAASIPTLSRYLPGIQLNGSTRTLSSNLREAQEKAITEQNQYLIRFFPANSLAKYQLIKIKNSVESLVKEVTLPTDESISLEQTIVNNQVVFSPDGGPSSSGNITLSLKGQTKIINVTPAGFIKIP